MRDYGAIDRLKRGVYLGLSLAGAFSLWVGYVALPQPNRENLLLLRTPRRSSSSP